MPRKCQKNPSEPFQMDAAPVTSPGRSRAGIELCLHPGGSKTSLKVELGSSSLDYLAVDPAGDDEFGMNPVLSPLFLVLTFPACDALSEL